MDPDDPAYLGQRDYSLPLLSIYDWWVIGIVAPLVWRCPVEPVLERYRGLIGRRHLDVGPGTGYFVRKVAGPETQVTLLDPNPAVLAYASRRLAVFEPTSVEADVLKPLPVPGPFDSASLSFVLHCLPGPQESKAAAIRNVAAVLTSDGVLFGGTVLGLSEPHTPSARAMLRAFNRRGAFDNLGDTATGLREILEASFTTVDVDVVGSIALFTARGPH